MRAKRLSTERQPGPLLQQVDRTCVIHNGRTLSYFGGCDYFRLSSHPKVLHAVREGLLHYGLNVAASRFTTGNHAVYEELESCLATYFGAPSATLTSTGYMAGAVAAQALANEFSHAFVDAESHSALTDSLPSLGSRISWFKRGDADDLSRRVRAARNIRKAIVITEGFFAHNGELAPLREYLAIMPRSGMLLLDDAHGAGILGHSGKGTVEELAIPPSRVIRTITLSKAFGVYGGAILGTRPLQRRIYAASSALVGTTPLPPPLAIAALTSVRILENEPKLRRRLSENVTHVKRALQQAGWPVGHPSTPIFGITPRDDAAANNLAKRLIGHGVYPSFICYPGGPRNGFFRFAISSEHRPEQLQALIAALT